MSDFLAAHDCHWREARDGAAWDREVARLDGHPLQSTLWGSARNKIDRIPQLFLVCRAGNQELKGLARVEVRSVRAIGKVAWIPKGPTFSAGADTGDLLSSLFAELKLRGFIACITDRYVLPDTERPGQPWTIWIDMRQGLESLSKNMDSQWRYGARRALREGVVVRTSTSKADVSAFFHLCDVLSKAKGFALPGSEALMQELIRSSSTETGVGMTLYVGEINGNIAGGALVARCGRHLHYLWGASSRQYNKYRVNEAVQWQIIQDGVALGMARYDLEGVDPVGNPGVYGFKRKMGGREVALCGAEPNPLTWSGRLVLGLGRLVGRLA